MVVKVVTTPCLQVLPKHKTINDGVLLPRSTNWLGTPSSNLIRTRSFEYHPKQKPRYSLRRASSADFASSIPNDKEFSSKIDELAFQFKLFDSKSSNSTQFDDFESSNSPSFQLEVEMKANCFDLPHSLRMIKQKNNQLKQNLSELIGESACCSVKKAFSSMVFIIRELHSYSLQMREALYNYEDLQGILTRVQSEMHASFVWLFEQVFSRTPTLMIYVMILLANFTVHSMAKNSPAFASVPSPPPIVTSIEDNLMSNYKNVDLFKPLSGTKSTSIGGNNGGRNNIKPVASGMDGDGWINLNSSIVSDGMSTHTTRDEESVSSQEEITAWNSILEDAFRMQGKIRGEYLNSEVTKWFVSPVTVKIESDQVEAYQKTELKYQTELAQEPNNVLLLANYAQFLYLVIQDYDRAEEYFKRAIGVEPKDAEAHNKYAHFLWQIRNDLWAAEETYLEAISADPSNSFYAANYAHFLWNTGGEDTCFPIDDCPQDNTIDT